MFGGGGGGGGFLLTTQLIAFNFFTYNHSGGYVCTLFLERVVLPDCDEFSEHRAKPLRVDEVEII